jgi:hypothetical protein
MDQIIYFTSYILSTHYLVLDRLFSSSQLREVRPWPISYEDYKSMIFLPIYIDIRNILPGTKQPGRGSKMCVKLWPAHATHTFPPPPTPH